MKETKELIKEIEKQEKADGIIIDWVTDDILKSKAKGMLIILKKWLKQVEDEIEFLKTKRRNFINFVSFKDNVEYLNEIDKLTTLKEDLIKDIILIAII